MDRIFKGITVLPLTRMWSQKKPSSSSHNPVQRKNPPVKVFQQRTLTIYHYMLLSSYFKISTLVLSLKFPFTISIINCTIKVITTRYPKKSQSKLSFKHQYSYQQFLFPISRFYSNVTEQEAHEPHCSPEKKVQSIYKLQQSYDYISRQVKSTYYLLLKRGTNKNLLYPRMLCAEFG